MSYGTEDKTKIKKPSLEAHCMPNNEIDGSLFTERVTKYQLIDLLTGNPPRKVIQALVGAIKSVGFHAAFLSSQ
ncbi:MAG: hypothetical protein COV52_02995 [Gammaproteobacteria bacterium CG11_big_fil_rev_8_21_14_0_20_46_22]|nr:MAG: hypothetical protein COW05_05945 [Gammaproteobacteria bacterium CG12_big_fil_rev_8_21_14_0_65_46_12]PIR11598.1 MAG: hypothetical protein COV52_02995 [Gammaproteobacteria bacterium CG11_big_fil_rev_8_21_14_0_20_46_22]